MAFNTVIEAKEVKSKVFVKTFTKNDLINNSLTITHSLITKVKEVTLYDPSGNLIISDGIVIDTTIYDKIVLNFNFDLETGNYLCLLKFYII